MIINSATLFSESNNNNRCSTQLQLPRKSCFCFLHVSKALEPVDVHKANPKSCCWVPCPVLVLQKYGRNKKCFFCHTSLEFFSLKFIEVISAMFENTNKMWVRCRAMQCPFCVHHREDTDKTHSFQPQILLVEITPLTIRSPRGKKRQTAAADLLIDNSSFAPRTQNKLEETFLASESVFGLGKWHEHKQLKYMLCGGKSWGCSTGTQKDLVVHGDSPNLGKLTVLSLAHLTQEFVTLLNRMKLFRCWCLSQLVQKGS